MTSNRVKNGLGVFREIFKKDRCEPSTAINVMTKRLENDEIGVRVITTKRSTVDFSLSGTPLMSDIVITNHCKKQREVAKLNMKKVNGPEGDGLNISLKTEGSSDVEFILNGKCFINEISIEEDSIVRPEGVVGDALEQEEDTGVEGGRSDDDKEDVIDVEQFHISENNNVEIVNIDEVDNGKKNETNQYCDSDSSKSFSLASTKCNEKKV